MILIDERHFRTLLENSTPEMIMQIIKNTHEQLGNTGNDEEEMEYIVDVRNLAIQYYADTYGIVELFVDLDKEYQEMFDDMQEHYQSKGGF